MSEVVVGLDFGSSSIKAVAYGRDGRTVATAATETPVATHSEGDDFLVGAMMTAAGEVIKALGLAPGAIVGLGTTSIGEVGAVVGDDSIVDLPFPAWYDSRGAEVVEQLASQFGAQDLRNATGRHFRLASSVAKLGHAVSARGDSPRGTFTGVSGALVWLLTGELWQEAGLATSSGVYDLLEGRYLEDVWAAAGLGSIALAPVLGPGSWFPARTSLAHEWGIRPGAPIMIAGHDHPVAAVGTGALPGDLVDSMGTGEAIIGVIQGPDALTRKHHVAALDADPMLSIEVWPATGEPLVVWERLRPGLAMRSFLERTHLSRDELDSQAPPPNSQTLVNDEVSLALEAGAPAELIYGPHMWAELLDFYVDHADYGQRLVRQATGSAGPVVLTGGGLRSRRWRASKALRAEGPIEVATARETGTRGCAAMVGVQLGWWEQPSSMPGATRIQVPHGDTEAMEAAARLIQ